MIQKIINRFNRLFTLNSSKSPYTPLDSDIYLISYPKSGNTWVRFLIGNYISKGEMDFTNGHLIMPDLHFNPEQIENISSIPRFIKSHEPYNNKYNKVIYIVRDGRAVAVSYYYFMIKLGQISKELSFTDYLNTKFLTGDVPFGDWQEHVLSWTSQERDSVLVIRYEDMLENIESEFRKILLFCGLPIIESDLKMAIEKASFEEMKKNELKNKDVLKRLGHDDNSGIPIIREGKSRGWMSNFNEADLDSFNKKYSQLLTNFRY
jgi:hypothetical protein